MAAPTGAAIAISAPKRSRSMRRRFALVFNSKAGVAVPRLLDGVLAVVRQSGAQVFQLPARNAAEAAERVSELARQGGCDAVIAAGGDGTFRAVATGAAGSGLAVGIIPLGTGNVLCHEIGLRRRARNVADVLLEGSEIDARGGLVNGEPFFLMTGAGFDARIVAQLNYRTKRALGRGAYTYPVIKTFTEGPRSFDVELDGRRFEASWVILTFASRYGGSFVLTRGHSSGARSSRRRRDGRALAPRYCWMCDVAGARAAHAPAEAAGRRSRPTGEACAHRLAKHRTCRSRWRCGWHIAHRGQRRRTASSAHCAARLCC